MSFNGQQDGYTAPFGFRVGSTPMRAKISYEDSRGRTLTTQVRLGQRLVVGSSFSADVVLGDTAGVVSEHAELYLKAKEFSIRNLTGNADTVLVNGKSTSKSVLADGDSIEIGSNKLAISINTQNSQKSTSNESSNALTDAKAVAGVSNSGLSNSQPNTPSDVSVENESFERHGNVSVMVIESFGESVFPLIAPPEAPWSCHLICNHQRSESTSEKPDSSNFLKVGPPEITENNDLFLVPVEDQAKLDESWVSYLEKDAGLIAINATRENESAIEEQKFQFLAAWFMIPSTLKFHLTNGSPLLLEKVFGLFDFLVVSDGAGSSQIITNDMSIDSFDSFLDRIKGVDRIKGAIE
jgi:pSer/pThr/pTyr-binding forkhead associated (FHA) protein